MYGDFGHSLTGRIIMKEDIIKLLRFEGAGFRMGGSRRMAEMYPHKIKVTPETDYDFYCAGTPAQIRLLTDNGFSLIRAENRSYWDNLLVDIYINKQYGIECLIRSDVDLYTKVFEWINPDDYALRLWKSNPDHPVHDMTAFRAACLGWFNQKFIEYNPDNLPF